MSHGVMEERLEIFECCARRLRGDAVRVVNSTRYSGLDRAEFLDRGTSSSVLAEVGAGLQRGTVSLARDTQGRPG